MHLVFGKQMHLLDTSPRRVFSSNKNALRIRSGLTCQVGIESRYFAIASWRLIPSGRRNNTISVIMRQPP